MAFAKRVDANHAHFRDTIFRRLCPVVFDTSKYGRGFPDLMIVTAKGNLRLVEIKSEKGKQKESQKEFALKFGPWYRLVKTDEEATKVALE